MKSNRSICACVQFAGKSARLLLTTAVLINGAFAFAGTRAPIPDASGVYHIVVDDPSKIKIGDLNLPEGAQVKVWSKAELQQMVDRAILDDKNIPQLPSDDIYLPKRQPPHLRVPNDNQQGE